MKQIVQPLAGASARLSPGDQMGHVYPLNGESVTIKQPDYPGWFVRLSSLIEHPEVNLNTYRAQRGMLEDRTHPVEHLAFESFDINLDDSGDPVSGSY